MRRPAFLFEYLLSEFRPGIACNVIRYTGIQLTFLKSLACIKIVDQ